MRKNFQPMEYGQDMAIDEAPFVRITSVRATLDIVGDQWMLLILRELFLGATTWTDFSSVLDIPASTLNRRLTQLVQSGSLEKLPGEKLRRAKYRLTKQGIAFFPLVAAAREWQLMWDHREGAFVSPWIHRCGHPLRVRSACSKCDEDVKLTEVSYKDGSNPGRTIAAPQRHFRMSNIDSLDKRSRDSHPPKIVQVLGDKRAVQILASMYYGCKKFDEIQKWTTLHPAIVSERLRKLQIKGIVHSRLYQENPDRYLHSLAAPGLDLSLVVLQMLHWGDKWVFGKGKEPRILTHIPCKSRLHSLIKCRHCNEHLRFADVTTSLEK